MPPKLAAPAIVIVMLMPFGAQAADDTTSGKDFGGVNLNTYCATYYGSNYRAAALGGRTAYDWACVPKIHHAGTVDHQISVQNACLLEYGSQGLAAVATNPRSAESWHCVQAPGKIHPLTVKPAMGATGGAAPTGMRMGSGHHRQHSGAIISGR